MAANAGLLRWRANLGGAEARSLASVLRDVRRRMKKAGRRSERVAEVFAALQEALPYSDIVNIDDITIKNSILYIKTSNHAWRSEFQMFRREQVLARLRELLPARAGIRDLRFS